MGDVKNALGINSDKYLIRVLLHKISLVINTFPNLDYKFYTSEWYKNLQFSLAEYYKFIGDSNFDNFCTNEFDF